MKIIIVGCGRLGSGLAAELIDSGEDVTVVCSEPERFRLLGDDFPGSTISGVEFDKEVLEKAGIKRADSLISCTESDETNALVARIAKNHYKVPKVIARLYDKRKVDIYNALGIQVIATTTWGISRVKELLTFSHIEQVMSIGNSPVEIIRVEIPELLAGKSIRSAFPMNDIRVIAISRGNHSFIPNASTKMQSHDIMYFSVMPGSIEELRRALDM